MLVKYLRRSPWSREVARGLVVLFLWPLVLCSLVGKSAQAQSKVKTIAVMDFENTTKRQGAALGRKAADAVALQLSPAAYEVLSRDAVARRIATLGLGTPLDRNGLAKLAAGMREDGLSEIFTGRVLTAEVRQGQPRQAHVRIEIRVMDADTGEFTNGAIGDASSSPRREDVSADVLIDEALGKAAFQAVTALQTRTIPRGTVLMSKGGEVIINIGAEQGVSAGMEMVILRDKMKVARVEVVSVTNRDCTARVKEEIRGIAPEDEARALYATSVDGKILSTTGLDKKKKGPRFGSVLSVLAGIGLLFLVGKMLKGKHPRNVGATGVRAVATLDGNNQPAVRISWSRPATPSGLDLLGFKVYRSTTRYGNYEVVAQVAGPNENQVFDTTNDRTIEVTYGGSSDGGSSDLDTDEVDVTGVRPGTTYYYRVTRLIVESSTSGGGSGDAGDVEFNVVETDYSPPTEGATPLNRPQIMSPLENDSLNLNSQVFQWLSVGGGDLYRLQVSDSPTFEPQRTFNSPDEDARMALPGAGDNRAMSATFNLSTRFPGINPNTGQTQQQTLFWRIGARHRSDGLAPEPDGFIFSDAVRIETIEMPPPPVQ